MPNPIKLTKKQTKFFSAVFDENCNMRGGESPYNEFASFGGFGSAKSYVVMLCTLLICANYPNTMWLYARATYPQLNDSVIRQFLDTFPPTDYQYTYKKQAKEFHFSNGSIIFCRAFDRDNKILSNMYHGASLCQAEEIANELFLQLWGRVRLGTSEGKYKNGIPKNIVFLEGNPSNGWCKERYKDNPLPESVFFIESTSFDNPFLPKDYVKNMENIYPEFWVKRYIYGEWNNFDEMVFSEFKESINIIEPFEIPNWYYKVNGFDYGWRNPSGIVYLATDDDKNVYIYDEFKRTQTLVDELSRQANKYGKITNVIDPSTKTPDRDGKDVFSELLIHGVNLIEANKDKKRNILMTNMMLKNKRLFIFRNCVETIKEMRNFKWKTLKLGENKNMPEEVIKKDDHLMDAMMYGLQYIEDTGGVDPVKKQQKESHLHEIYNQYYIEKERNAYG